MHNHTHSGLVTSSAPSSPPRNVSLNFANSTSITLSWLPPVQSEQNGVIQHYLIQATEENTMSQFQLTSTSTSAAAIDLHPYYTYSFAVTAVTVGQGPYSEEISVQTWEDGK